MPGVNTRRGFLTGLVASAFAAPGIVRSASLMQIRGLVMPPHRVATIPAAIFDRWCGNDLVAVLHPSMFEAICRQADGLHLKGLQRGEIGCWQGIRFIPVEQIPAT